MWRQKAAAAGESVEAEVPQETSRPHQEMKPLDPLHIERQTSSGQDLDWKNKKILVATSGSPQPHSRCTYGRNFKILCCLFLKLLHSQDFPKLDPCPRP